MSSAQSTTASSSFSTTTTTSTDRRGFKEAFAFVRESSHYQSTSAANPSNNSRASLSSSSTAQQNQQQTSKSRDPRYPNVRVSTLPADVRGGSFPLLVNERQRGNPVLEHVKRVVWEFAPVRPDYVMSRTSCALFLSIRYHLLHPNYIFERMRDLKQSYELRVLIVLVDVDDCDEPLRNICNLACMSEFTAILSWTAKEAARYLETFKAYEKKTPDDIQGKTDNSYTSQFAEVMTKIRGINKTDSSTLMSQFSNLAGVAKAESDALSQCPGFGDKKVQNVLSALHKPFSSSGPSNIQRKKAYDPKEEEEYAPISAAADQRASPENRSSSVIEGVEDTQTSNSNQGEVIELT